MKHDVSNGQCCSVCGKCEGFMADECPGRRGFTVLYGDSKTLNLEPVGTDEWAINHNNPVSTSALEAFVNEVIEKFSNSGWRPWNTVPEMKAYGDEIDVWFEVKGATDDGYRVTAWWDGFAIVYERDGSRTVVGDYGTPTHWRPAPEAPK